MNKKKLAIGLVAAGAVMRMVDSGDDPEGKLYGEGAPLSSLHDLTWSKVHMEPHMILMIAGAALYLYLKFKR